MIRPGAGKPVIDPVKWIREEGVKLPTPNLILTYWDSPLNALAEFLRGDYEELSIKTIPIHKPLRGRWGGVEFVAAKLNFGAPASVLALELLIAAGGRNFLVYGGAGSLTPDLRIGDVLVPTWGVREEGTSYHYLPPHHVPRPHPELTKELIRVLRAHLSLLGSRVEEGGVWSTDAVFRETEDKVREYGVKGVKGVDMEATALMSVAEYRGANLSLALVITDELFNGVWRTPSEEGWRRIEGIEGEVMRSFLITLKRFTSGN